MSVEKYGPTTHACSVVLSEYPMVSFMGDYRPAIRIVRHAKPGQMVLDVNEFIGMKSSHNLQATFVETDEDKMGRKESGHGVYFGQLLLDSEADHELPTPVAVKPFHPILGRGQTDALVHEWAANMYVSRLSAYERAYLPLGVWKDKDRVPQLITLFDEQTQTLDNIFWAEGPVAEKIGPEKIVRALGLGLYALGVLHGAGLVHNDAQIKNFARDSKQVRFVDLESLEFLDQHKGHIVNKSDNRRAIQKDINIFAASLVRYNDMKNEYMFKKVETAITNEQVAYESVRMYWPGIAQGQLRNGTTIDEQLVISPESLFDVFNYATAQRYETKRQIEAFGK